MAQNSKLNTFKFCKTRIQIYTQNVVQCLGLREDKCVPRVGRYEYVWQLRSIKDSHLVTSNGSDSYNHTLARHKLEDL